MTGQTAPIAIAAAHRSAILLDRRAGLDLVAGVIAEAGSAGVRLVGFPETFVPGYPYWLSVTPFDEQRALNARYAAESVDLASDDLAPVRRTCQRHRVNVVLGVSERRGGTLFNTQLFIADDGDVRFVRRKLQPTLVERAIWSQGDGSGLRVAQMSVGRVGGLICGEHSMNLARHALILGHEQFHVGAWPGGGTARALEDWFDGHVAALSRTHAYTAGCYLIAASDPLSQQGIDVIRDALGEQPKLQVGVATSTIFGPWGTVVATHSGSAERLVIGEADPSLIQEVNMQHDSCGHSARSDILRLTVDTTPYLEEEMDLAPAHSARDDRAAQTAPRTGGPP
jgi:predicted amidohydrolase